jgi:solute carrier family 25 S-adenosylmethionine transporter 26
MAAGATAGAAVESALYPIDTIKTRLQVARAGGGIVWKGLYKGLAGNIAGVIPASAIFMGVYEPVKRTVKDCGGSDLAAQFAAATLAGTAASLVRVPTEVVKQRMQMGEFGSATGAVRAILAKEGLRKGLYAGYGSFLLRDLPFDAIEFIAYEQAKSAYKAMVQGRELNPAEHSAIGAVAGVSTAVLTTPLDVIKTRLMTQGAAGRYKGIIDCCRTLVREEGAAALMKGVGPRVTWIGIGGSVFFTCLEASKKVFLPLAGAA